jgi:hypothetical protein
MKQAKQTLIAVTVLAIILPLATLAIPAPADPIGTVQEFRAATITTTLFAWLHIGAAWMFLLGLDGFKERLKRAYRVVCLGLLMLGLAQLQYPVLSVFELWYSPWVTEYAGLSLPNLVASVFLFLGIRSFARALNDKSWLLSPSVVPLAVLLGAAGSLVLPGLYRLDSAAIFAHIILGLVNAVLVLRIKRVAGPAYTNALAWFFMALVVTIGSSVMVVILDNLHVERGPILGVPAALAGILFVKAGYAFNKIKEY